MKDMTQGSVTRHLLASFIAVSMVVQTLYLLGRTFTGWDGWEKKRSPPWVSPAT